MELPMNTRFWRPIVASLVCLGTASCQTDRVLKPAAVSDPLSLEAMGRQFDRRYCTVVQPPDPPGHNGPAHFFAPHCVYNPVDFANWLRMVAAAGFTPEGLMQVPGYNR
jgi:hypothetical protein